MLSGLHGLAVAAGPLIFTWDAKMIAEWPRGKVLKLRVEDGSFEAQGSTYQLLQDESRYFSWKDGTLQRVHHIENNVIFWSTEHAMPAWRRFKWVCTPQCRCVGCHDMQVADAEPYECHLCTSRKPAERHWHCEEHKVHLCQNCAQLPPDGPTLGVAASFVVDIFPSLASTSTGKENPNFYEICPVLACGTNGLGFQKTCPRDGKPHCSIVDSLTDDCNQRNPGLASEISFGCAPCLPLGLLFLQ